MAAAAALLAAAPARADHGDNLVSMINQWRAAPGSCEGRRVAPLPPLRPNRALAQIGIRSGRDLKYALEDAGYRPRHSGAISVTDAGDAHTVLAMLQQDYCYMVLDARFVDIGTARSGGDWQIVLAQPLAQTKLQDWSTVGKAILRAANTARATSRNCGGRIYAAAPPMKWSPVLGEAALEHSRDMAHGAHLSHQGSDGSSLGDRLTRVGYNWGLSGENIVEGVGTAEEAVDSWVASPGHCANLMNPTFTEMGAAYATDRARRSNGIYWAQVLSTPRR